jgi:threonine 3-dehydrogenase
MKALVKARAEPGIWMQDVPEPTVGHNDVLIKVHRSAICGTDMHIYNWDAWAQKTVPVPMAVGHEYSGEIVEVGSEVRGSLARGISPAAIAVIAAQDAGTCAATPRVSA